MVANPNYTADISDATLSQEKQAEIKLLKERKTSNRLMARDTLICGNFATASFTDGMNGQNYLSGLGGNCGANGRSCARMTCQNTSGTYFCNVSRT
jgi:hypothetical protein